MDPPSPEEHQNDQEELPDYSDSAGPDCMGPSSPDAVPPIVLYPEGEDQP